MEQKKERKKYLFSAPEAFLSIIIVAGILSSCAKPQSKSTLIHSTEPEPQLKSTLPHPVEKPSSGRVNKKSWEVIKKYRANSGTQGKLKNPKFGLAFGEAMQKRNPAQYMALEQYSFPMEHDPKYFPLHWAIINFDETLLTSLVGFGEDVNTKDTMKNSPLDIAIMICNEPMVKTLIDHGADVHGDMYIRRRGKVSRQYMATEFCGESMANLLVNKGTVTNIKRGG